MTKYLLNIPSGEKSTSRYINNFIGAAFPPSGAHPSDRVGTLYIDRPIVLDAPIKRPPRLNLMGTDPISWHSGNGFLKGEGFKGKVLIDELTWKGQKDNSAFLGRVEQLFFGGAGINFHSAQQGGLRRCVFRGYEDGYGVRLRGDMFPVMDCAFLPRWSGSGTFKGSRAVTHKGRLNNISVIRCTSHDNEDGLVLGDSRGFYSEDWECETTNNPVVLNYHSVDGLMVGCKFKSNDCIVKFDRARFGKQFDFDMEGYSESLKIITPKKGNKFAPDQDGGREQRFAISVVDYL